MSEEPERIVLDELVVTSRIPKLTPDPNAELAHHVLASHAFLHTMTRSIARILAQDSLLAIVTVEVSL
jgi:hypothetical protein